MTTPVPVPPPAGGLRTRTGYTVAQTRRAIVEMDGLIAAHRNAHERSFADELAQASAEGVRADLVAQLAELGLPAYWGGDTPPPDEPAPDKGCADPPYRLPSNT